MSNTKVYEYSLEARRIIKLANDAVNGFNKGEIEPIAKYIKAKEEFFKNFDIEKSIVNLSSNAEKDDIKKVLRNETIADKLYHTLFKEPFSVEYDDEEITNLALDTFYSWYSGEDYVRAMLDIDRIFVNSHFDKEIEILFSEARRCYTLQQYKASLMMCRLVLEKYAIKVLKKTGTVKYKNKEKGWIDYTKCIKKFDDKIYSTIKPTDLYNKLCDISHGKADINVKDAFKSTINIIEKISNLKEYSNLGA